MFDSYTAIIEDKLSFSMCSKFEYYKFFLNNNKILFLLILLSFFSNLLVFL